MEEKTNEPENQSNDSDIILYQQKVRRRNDLNIRMSSLMLGTFLFAGSASLIYLDVIKGSITSRLDSIIGITLLIILTFSSILGINLIFQTFINDGEGLKKYYGELFQKISNGIINMIFVSLFITALVFMLIILIDASIIFGGREGNDEVLFHTQVLVSVCLGGFLGGFVRETYSRFLISKDEISSIFITRFWVIIFSLLGSVLLSVIFFLLLRAGILKSESVDSFNLYGVTGISTITGYLSDRVLKRFSILYTTLFEGESSLNNETSEEKKKTDDNKG